MRGGRGGLDAQHRGALAVSLGKIYIYMFEFKQEMRQVVVRENATVHVWGSRNISDGLEVHFASALTSL